MTIRQIFQNSGFKSNEKMAIHLAEVWLISIVTAFNYLSDDETSFSEKKMIALEKSLEVLNGSN